MINVEKMCFDGELWMESSGSVLHDILALIFICAFFLCVTLLYFSFVKIFHISSVARNSTIVSVIVVVLFGSEPLKVGKPSL